MSTAKTFDLANNTSVFQTHGPVQRSSAVSQRRACCADPPHISALGCRLPHTRGRVGWPKIRQRLSPSSCTQRTPAGLPCGMPGMGLLMLGAMQHAPQPDRHASTGSVPIGRRARGNQLSFMVHHVHAHGAALAAHAQHLRGGHEFMPATRP